MGLHVVCLTCIQQIQCKRCFFIGEVLFNSNEPHFPPDIIFGDNEEDFEPDLEQMPVMYFLLNRLSNQATLNYIM